jgi:hypothetical protein
MIIFKISGASYRNILKDIVACLLKARIMKSEYTRFYTMTGEHAKDVINQGTFAELQPVNSCRCYATASKRQQREAVFCRSE